MKYFSDSLAIFPVMALVNITTILADTQRILKKIKPPGCIELLSDKRNRGIAIIKREEQLLVPYRTISCFFAKKFSDKALIQLTSFLPEQGSKYKNMGIRNRKL